VGRFATTVGEYLRERFAEQQPALAWETEYRIAGTPVDIAGVGEGRLVLVELEWRRADPADNAAKLFRHLDTGTVDRQRVDLFHVFTRYYTLQRGGVSSKRKNAEFVGRIGAETIDRLSYTPVEFDIDPPKRGGDLPADWRTVADAVVATVGEQPAAER